MLAGFRKQAIRHLAEAPTDSSSFNLAVHRAALLATQGYISQLEELTPPDKSETASVAKLNYTIPLKLLAANLISNNHLYEGVEMLCILGMHLEACRYLETYNEWGTAVWLAKVRWLLVHFATSHASAFRPSLLSIPLSCMTGY